MLAVEKMARGVVSHALAGDGLGGALRFTRLKLLTHVAYAAAEVCGWLGQFRIVRQEMFVGREHRATAAGVCDDRIAGVKGGNVSLC